MSAAAAIALAGLFAACDVEEAERDAEVRPTPTLSPAVPGPPSGVTGRLATAGPTPTGTLSEPNVIGRPSRRSERTLPAATPPAGTPGSAPASTASPGTVTEVSATTSPSLTPTLAPETPATQDTRLALVYELVEYPLPGGSRPHDVAPAPDGRVWYTAQGSGDLGVLDPDTGETRHIPLGRGSAPHGVIVGPDGAPWVTDSGLNAIVRVDPVTGELLLFPLPASAGYANLNTAAFDASGRIWFTGQSGIYGVLDPASGEMSLFEAPRGRGPYGIAATPSGDIYFASLAGSYVARIDLATGAAAVLELPTADQGARRVWSDSAGRIWASEWNAGQVAVLDPAAGRWREWPLPGPAPRAYAVYVDEFDAVWLSDFGANALVRFDPATEEFLTFLLPSTPGNVRQILGRSGEIWGAESAADALVVIRFQPAANLE